MRNAECAACGATDNLQYHHLIPRSMGGSDDETNLITLCGDCHAKAHGVRANWGHSELIRRGLQAKKARGERTGSVPYGYQLAADSKHIVPDATEQEILRVVHTSKGKGASLRTIAAELTARGFKSRGQAWNPKTIKSIADATLQATQPEARP